MKTINKRIIFVVIIAIIFFGMTDVLMYSMFSKSKDYATKSINSHLYDSGILISAGQILDVNGNALAFSKDGKRYFSDDETVRKSCLHLVGDDSGYISNGVQSKFREELCGYDIVHGVNLKKAPTVNLSIDSSLCADALRELDSHKGCVAIANYKTGAIVCLTSSPTYDVYDKPDDIEENDEYDGVYINRLYEGLYTPGSVFKVVTSLCALENISDIETRTFHCDGSYKFDDGGEVVCNDTHGDVTFEQALNQSCNVAFAQIANELGEEKIKKTYAEIGLDKKYETNDRLSTLGGTFKIDKTSTPKTELGWAGIGQSTVLVNPYSYLTFMCALANGGKASLPYFVASAENGYGRYSYLPKPIDSGIDISPELSSKMREMMRSNVENFYGDYMFGDVTMCGKTGTAERDGINSTAWFGGFSYDDSFPYAVVVVVEESGSGLHFAGQIAADLMQTLYDKLN